MLSLSFFLKGLIVGIFVSAPMGPIGVLCVQKTVSRGRIKGFFSGMGAATADTFYAILVAFGVTFVSNFLTQNQKVFQIVGVSVLFLLGVKMIFKNPIKEYRQSHHNVKKRQLIKDYISVFFLTISNPLTLLFFGAAFTMFGLISATEKSSDSFLLVMGIFSGATLWWFALTSIVAKFRTRFKLRGLFMMNRISGFVIIALAITAVIKLFLL